MQLKNAISRLASLGLMLCYVVACGGSDATEPDDRPEDRNHAAAPVVSKPTATLARLNINKITEQQKAKLRAPVTQASGVPNPTATTEKTVAAPNPTGAAPVSAGFAHGVLVPDDSRTNDVILLQDIYQQIDLNQFALEPTAPIDWLVNYSLESVDPRTDDIPTYSRILAWHTINTNDPTFLREHPYFHALSDLSVEELDAQYPGANGMDQVIYHDRTRIQSFIDSPYWQGVDVSLYEDQDKVFRDGPYYFGPGSTKTVLGDTVISLIESSIKAGVVEEPSMMFNEDRLLRVFRDGDQYGLSRYPVWGEYGPWTLAEHLRTPMFHISHRSNLITGSNFAFSTRVGAFDWLFTHPLTQWEILDPDLPIVRITSYHQTKLPLAGPGEDYSISKFASSFVISFQHRWSSFDDSGRYNTEQHWNSIDFMQHRIIGPVVVEIYDSEVLETGIYSAYPEIDHWEAPGCRLDETRYQFTYYGFHEARRLDRTLETIQHELDQGRIFNIGGPYPARPSALQGEFPFPGHLSTRFNNDARRNFDWWAYADADCTS